MTIPRRIQRRRLKVWRMPAEKALTIYSAPMQIILRRTAALFGVWVVEILSPQRTAKVARARHAAMYLARELTPYSLTHIGRIMNRDHSTVRYGCKAARRRIREDESFAVAVALLRRHLVRLRDKGGKSDDRP